MTQRARGCVSAVLFLFAGWVGVAVLFARIESDQELRALLLIDCLVGLALCGHIVLAGEPRLEVRKRWIRRGLAVAAGVLTSSLLVSLHVFQVEVRRGARERIEEREEKTIRPESR